MSTDAAADASASAPAPAAAAGDDAGASGGGAAAVAARHMRRGGRRSGKKRSARPSEYIRLRPADAVNLQLKRSGSADKFSAQLEISNPSEHRIMFRMRTTNPSRYQVTPRTGIIDSVSVVNTQIGVGSEAAAELKELLRDGSTTVNDKFRVESIVLTPPMLQRLRDKTTQAKEMSSIWQEAHAAGQIASNTVVVNMPKLTSASSAPAAAAPAPASSQQREAAVAPVVSQVAAPPSDSQPVDAAVSMEDMEQLRNVYNDLVRFTVSTAAQHDEQVSRLTLQLEAANKRYAEAQARLKDVGGDGVRRRATGAGATEGKSSDDNGAGGAGTAEPEVRVVRSGFPLWQVIIVAVIMFVLGTIMGQS